MTFWVLQARIYKSWIVPFTVRRRAGSSFAYGVGLWWEFLSIELGESIAADYLEALEGMVPDDDTALELIVAFIELSGQSLNAFWDKFALFNLATGARAGKLESYWDADKMYGLRIDELRAGQSVDATRFYPLTAHYYEPDESLSSAHIGASKLEGNLRGTLIEADEQGVPSQVLRTFRLMNYHFR